MNLAFINLLLLEFSFRTLRNRKKLEKMLKLSSTKQRNKTAGKKASELGNRRKT